jgi:riboflavin synthase
MFTGIVTAQGKFKGYRRHKSILLIEAAQVIPELPLGESLAVDGVCLSLVRKEKNIGYFNLSQETLEKTTLGHLTPGWLLNLEPPLRLDSLLSGHLVSGHVDGTGQVDQVISRGQGKRIRIKFPPSLQPFFIPKGSVAVNGVSLTVASLQQNYFECELIPVTLDSTNLGRLKTGQHVNLECDIIGKYMYNLLSKLGVIRSLKQV